MKKKQEYMIIIFEDKKRKRLIQRSRSYKLIKKKYNEMLKKSNEMKFYKNIVNSRKGVKKIVHEIAIVTDDEKRKSFYEFSTRKIKTDIKKYKIVLKNRYNIEEKIYVKPDEKYIFFNELEKLIESMEKNSTIYQIHNKLFFEKINGHYKMCILKNVYDANRLYGLIKDNKNHFFIGKLKQQIIKKKEKSILNFYNITYQQYHSKRTKY